MTSLDDASYSRETQFKGWTVNDIMQHLYMGDTRAFITLT
jgi:hypothetical protein